MLAKSVLKECIENGIKEGTKEGIKERSKEERKQGDRVGRFHVQSARATHTRVVNDEDDTH